MSEFFIEGSWHILVAVAERRNVCHRAVGYILITSYRLIVAFYATGKLGGMDKMGLLTMEQK
jgi:hypothetical protein